MQQQALRDFDQALKNWRAGTHGRPRWRKRGINEGFCIRDVRVAKLNGKWAEVTVPKCGRVRFRLSRALPPNYGVARVTLDGKRRWHVSFQAPQPALERESSGRAVGIDRGVATTIATSDGRMFRAPTIRPREKRRLRSLQQRKARQKKGSRRQEATKARIAGLHQRMADRRRNWIEINTTRLVRGYDLLAVENLQVRNMVRRPAPKPDPDREGVFLHNGAKQKAALNRSIHAQGWGLWLKRLQDKAEACGVTVSKVPAAHTSDTCRACGHSAPENRENQTVFRCLACGHQDHADINAASNILARAQALASTPGPGASGTQPVPAQAHPAERVAAGTPKAAA